MDELTLKRKSSRHELNQNIALVPQHFLRTTSRQPQSPTKTMSSPIPTITLSTPSFTPHSLSPVSSPVSSPASSFTTSFPASPAITESLPKRVPPPDISKEIDIPAAFAFFQTRLTARNHAKRALARNALNELNPIYVRIAKWYLYRSGPQKYRDEVDARGEQPGNPHRFEEFLIVSYAPKAPTWSNNLLQQRAIWNTCRLHRDETLKAAFHIKETTMYEFNAAAEHNFTYAICKFWGKRRKLEVAQNEFDLSETSLVDIDYEGFDVVRGNEEGQVPYETRDTRQWEIDAVLDDNDTEHMERVIRVGGGRTGGARHIKRRIKDEDKKAWWMRRLGKKEEITFEEYAVDAAEVERLVGAVVYTGGRDLKGRGEEFEGFGGIEKVKEVVEEKLEGELLAKIVDLDMEEESGSLEGYESENLIDREIGRFHDSADITYVEEDSDEN